MEESTEIRNAWEQKYSAAIEFMRARSSRSGLLIEVAAQHPLRPNGEPDVEFEARLKLGASLFRATADQGPVEIYVPGSRHREGNIIDVHSLSAAGKTYLEGLGVPNQAIRGDDLNTQYRGNDGVYGSADECYVTASYFKDRGFGTLRAVMSPIQLTRKALHYINFGVMPLMHTAPTMEAYHDLIGEVFDAVPRVLFDDPYLTPNSSSWAQSLRRSRRPESS